jgi:hypothetical protein
MLRKAPSHGDGACLCFTIKNCVIICYLKAFFSTSLSLKSSYQFMLGSLVMLKSNNAAFLRESSATP